MIYQIMLMNALMLGYMVLHAMCYSQGHMRIPGFETGPQLYKADVLPLCYPGHLNLAQNRTYPKFYDVVVTCSFEKTDQN